MRAMYVPIEELPAAFDDLSYNQRYGIAHAALDSIERYGDLRNLAASELAFMQAQFPDLIVAVEGLRKAKRLLEFETRVVTKAY